MPIDPGAQSVLDLIRQLGRPPIHTLTPAEAREASAKSRAILQPEPAEVAEVEDMECPGPRGPIRLRRYRAAGTSAAEKLPCLLYLHGGGWVIGDLDSHDQPCRTLANAARCCVIAVDYRMAPEHLYPAAVEDCAAALRFVAAQAEALRLDPARLAVGGDSAGGNLAAVLAIMSRDGSLPPVGFQMLLYPACDMAAEYPAYQRFTEGLILTDKTMRWFIDHYVPEKARRYEWQASPLRAASLAGTATAYVMTAGYDPLVDEGIAYAKRLEADGVRVTHVHMADQIHAFLTMGKFIPASDLALRHAALSLAHHWAQG
ncbi:alpha/beta hydrolase [Siccirubricoccus sp. KC 17139]|uniref:Alpha/beta hydrolase n=1 Tax=Siccirubricoccus soli TaxID=2899147 RepID=A0ABT1DFL5_9PROT|nr:alpha/beta hydrolase [Siccirubricoccus soli]MCO6419984.1 alpha/beta hydrolase [Siccirubricoccus soli]MCP2686119.1 alpha/beta hydrolase [Siccirubricoccus soli]